jgi:hypothetical protein
MRCCTVATKSAMHWTSQPGQRIARSGGNVHLREATDVLDNSAAISPVAAPQRSDCLSCAEGCNSSMKNSSESSRMVKSPDGTNSEQP